MKKVLIFLLVLLSFIQCKRSSQGVNRPENIQEETKTSSLNTPREMHTGVSSLLNNNWEAVEIMGNQVDKTLNNPSFLLLTVNGKFTASGGCNLINGYYQLEAKNELKFSNMASTKKACTSVDYDTELIKALEMVEHFRISENKLWLGVGKRAPLAIFRIAAPD